ncbi:MAG: tetratricopeptide repeat protein [Thermoplasmatota archaeon]|nr:hypothetical protein [Halobacteriales archaeon]
MGLWTVCAGLALSALPYAAAEQVVAGDLVMRGADTDQNVVQSATLLMLAAERLSGQGAPLVSVHGDAIAWTQVEDNGPTVRVPSATGGDDLVFRTGGLEHSVTGDTPQQQEAHATFNVTEAQEQFVLHLYSSSPLAATASMDGCTTDLVTKPHLTRAHGIDEDANGDPNDRTPPSRDFYQFSLGQPVVRTTAHGQSTLTVEGDFTLEILGVSGKLVGDAGEHLVRSGTWESPLAPGLPGGNAYSEDRVFVRMSVTHGSATFVFAPDVERQWAGPGASVVGAALTLDSAVGSVQTVNGDVVAVNAAHYKVPGRARLDIRPDPAGLAAKVTGLDEGGNALHPAAATARLPDSLVGGLAIGVAAAAALGAGIWWATRRARKEPAMADVEASLEAGRFRRAARDAGRILHRQPGKETALISRAIALSKAGRNRRVVREVEGHLESRQPSDGVLHYVLGIAYVDLGRPKEAEVAFQEALRRTPDLLPEVQARLPSGSRLPAPSTKSPGEANGYA